MATMPHYFEHTVSIPVTADVLFEYLDDPRRLGAHMETSSWMMAGSRMEYQFDTAEGKSEGAKIRLRGEMMGLSLDVEEVVTEHQPPCRKTWKTVGSPRLLVIGNYEMGFFIKPSPLASELTVHISYELPPFPWNLVGYLLGGIYSRWCVRRMATDAVHHFTPTSS